MRAVAVYNVHACIPFFLCWPIKFELASTEYLWPHELAATAWSCVIINYVCIKFSRNCAWLLIVLLQVFLNPLVTEFITFWEQAPLHVTCVGFSGCPFCTVRWCRFRSFFLGDCVYIAQGKSLLLWEKQKFGAVLLALTCGHWPSSMCVT